MTGLTGFALLPDAGFAERLIEFRKACGDLIVGPIGMPHVTLLQSTFVTSIPFDRILDELVPIGKVGAMVENVYHKPYRWIFAGVIPSAKLKELHDDTVQHAATYIDRNTIGEPELGLSYWEINSQQFYGYPYVGSLFRPHFTIGKLKKDAPLLLPQSVALRYEEFELNGFVFDRVIYYRAGENGACVEILGEREL